jgi:hypothetical protein
MADYLLIHGNVLYEVMGSHDAVVSSVCFDFYSV